MKDGSISSSGTSRSSASTTAELPALGVRDLTKTFVGSRALDAVNFDVRGGGGVHALLGGNGSGKSTLIKILAGVYRGDPGGEIRVHGEQLKADHASPARSRELGLRFVHQDPGIFGALTVAENIALVNGWSSQGGRIPWRAVRERTQRLLDRFDIVAAPEQKMETLAPADQTMVAIARALEDLDSALSILVLDEPTASLPAHEVEVLLEAVRACAANGQTIIYVSHRIEEVMAIADSVTVLRDGKEEVTRSTEGLTEAQLVQHIIGRPIESVLLAPPAVSTEEAVLEVEDLATGPLEAVSLHVNRGEIVGVAGLIGSGRTELLRALFGVGPIGSGAIRIEGRERKMRSISAAMKYGIAYVPENRGLDAAFLDLSVKENISAANVRRFWRGFRFAHRAERRATQEDIDAFSIRAASLDAVFASLSGGNQQKAVLARWLRLRPKLLLLDEPTQGVDIGARADVYKTIDAAVNEGLAVLLVSSDFEELARVSDRVLVLRDGRITAELQSAGLDAGRVTGSVYGAKKASA